MKAFPPFILILVLTACAGTPREKIISEISKIYQVNEPDTMGDGALIYVFDARCSNKDSIGFANPLKADVQIKGIVDKSLKVLPAKTNIGKFSTWCNCILNIYEWETIETKVLMENSFKKSDEGAYYLECKIWITEK